MNPGFYRHDYLYFNITWKPLPLKMPLKISQKLYTNFHFAKTKYNWQIGNFILNHTYVYKIYYVCITVQLKRKKHSKNNKSRLHYTTMISLWPVRYREISRECKGQVCNKWQHARRNKTITLISEQPNTELIILLTITIVIGTTIMRETTTNLVASEVYI